MEWLAHDMHAARCRWTGVIISGCVEDQGARGEAREEKGRGGEGEEGREGEIGSCISGEPSQAHHPSTGTVQYSAVQCSVQR